MFERLAADYDVVGYFHNPNIHPLEEYVRRAEEAKRVGRILGFTLEPALYAPDAWDRAVAGLENEPETGARCTACFRHNLMAAAAKARELKIYWFTTTLTISPHKSSARIFEIGREAAAAHGVRFLETDFKKKDGFKRSLEMSKELNLYRQNYCGCKYSLRS
ncbi:MAG: epoxyqueuosine reductase QueH [Candidatus Firestonebacteria bacterium]|nr:epoxyqueuosine reductase QueH [Candidatus Firestonebacteria bacterium]